MSSPKLTLVMQRTLSAGVVDRLQRLVYPRYLWEPVKKIEDLVWDHHTRVWLLHGLELRGLCHLVGYMVVMDIAGDAKFIHDLAVLPEFRGRGLGKSAVQRVQQRSEQSHSLHLVSLPESVCFWERQGFQASKPTSVCPPVPAHFPRNSLRMSMHKSVLSSRKTAGKRL
jgi:GNAT superfamily N-acetyltransferase